ncbi:hypothetical protein IC232_03695 [Microvirga sp. BT688]|uniref:hypothetical protein n=1 Tax=Microvirga sp. TaxID=1873136 RepID=UPI001688F639|nr:hypothetical protein [Microvirga sp.]MBD2745794.1 hypothetical protein [Microvirga sp.]
MAPQRTFAISGTLNEESARGSVSLLGSIVLEGVTFQVSTQQKMSKDKRPFQAVSGKSETGEVLHGAIFTFSMTPDDIAHRRPCFKGKLNRGEKVYHVAGWYNTTPEGQIIRVGENKRKGS